MNTVLTYSRLLLCLLLFAVGGSPFLAAQNEAEAASEEMVFQKRNRPEKEVTIKIGEQIKYPVYLERSIREEQANVTSIGDSVMVVTTARGEERILDLRTLPYLKKRRLGRYRWGLALSIIGFITSGLISALAIAIAVSFGGIGLGALVATILLSFISNYFILIGVPLWATATRKMWLRDWSFSRRIRTRVRKAAPAKKKKQVVVVKKVPKKK